jgi:general secretion pathway protein D
MKDMRKSWATIALGAVLTIAFMGTATVSSAQQSTNDVRVDVNLKDADMVEATRAITMKTGLQFVFEGSNEPFNHVTLKLDGVTADDAIGYICSAAGAYFRRDLNGVYIISRTKPVEASAPNTPGSPKVVRFIKQIRLMKADPVQVYQQVLGRIYIDRGFEELKRITHILTDDVGLRGPGLSPTILQNNTPTDQMSLPTPTRNYGGPMTGHESGNDIALPGTEAAARLASESAGQLGGFGGGAGAGGGQGLGGGAGGGQGGPGAAGNAKLTGGQGLVPASITFISYDPTDNSIIVQGTSEDDIAELQRTISLFDQAPQQVQIKVEFITTTETLSRSLGYDFLYQRGPVFAGTSPGSFARTSDPVFLNYATGNVTTRLRAKLDEDSAKVVSAPIVRTLNNQTATITSSISTYIFITTTTISNGTVLTQSNPQQLVASTSLTVTPRINGDRTITIYLTPQVSNFVGSTTGPDGQQFPNQAFQGLQLVARVRDGETIVLGGLTQKSDSTNVSRIPVLSDLPIIGQFFKGTQRDRNNSDLLVFVTPTIIEDDDTGGG